jgi:Spy/CpxP family protein refolding chaperone
MARPISALLTVLLVCVTAVSAAAGAQGRPDRAAQGKGDRDKAPAGVQSAPNDRERWKWWLYDRAELGITDQQSRDINQIFEATLPKLRETRHEMERAEAELSRTIKEHKADLGTISLLIDRVESARSQNAKLRVMMLYRIDLLLSPEQRTKVEALRARQDAARRDRDRERERGKAPEPGQRRFP